MLEALVTAHVPSVFAIDYEKLAALGYKGILFDIDNTLVHHGDDSPRQRWMRCSAISTAWG